MNCPPCALGNHGLCEVLECDCREKLRHGWKYLSFGLYVDSENVLHLLPLEIAYALGKVEPSQQELEDIEVGALETIKAQYGPNIEVVPLYPGESVQ